MPSYQEQLDRVRRYYERFKRINDGLENNTVPLDQHLDDVHAFFQNCYHLKDWLKNDRAYRKHTGPEVEEYVSTTRVLAVCADICNGSKHLILSRGPRSGAQPTFGPRIISIELTDSLSGKDSPTVLKLRVEIDHGGRKLDAFQLASDALEAWTHFV